MSRYVDADAFLKEYCEPYPHIYKAMSRAMADAPSIDIVRCKECKHWTGETEHYEDREYKACWQLCGQYVNSEFWCKYGEREGE